MKPIDKTFNLRGNSSLRQVNYGRFWLDDWMIQAKLHGDFLMPKMLRTYLRIHHEHGYGSIMNMAPWSEAQELCFQSLMKLRL